MDHTLKVKSMPEELKINSSPVLSGLQCTVRKIILVKIPVI